MVVALFRINFGIVAHMCSVKAIKYSVSLHIYAMGRGTYAQKQVSTILFIQIFYNFKVVQLIEIQKRKSSFNTFPYIPKLWYNEVIPLFSLNYISYLK